MDLLSDIAELIAPTQCGSCDALGELMCKDCLNVLHEYASQWCCPQCAAPYGELICTECCEQNFKFTGAVALGVFEPPLSRVVITYKDRFEERLGHYLGTLLGLRCALAYGSSWPNIVTWVPPSEKGLAKRGFDHAMLLAQGVANILGCDLLETCRHLKNFDMRVLSRTERQEASKESFSLRSSGVDVAGKKILLVDDVLTTGSTLSAISEVLLKAGAEEVRVAVVARAW